MKKMKKMKEPRLTEHKYVERNWIAVFLLIIFTLSGCSAKGISVRRRVTSNSAANPDSWNQVSTITPSIITSDPRENYVPIEWINILK